MVFFTCNACGESLKKNQVEKHWRQRCRGCTVLTCVDCHRDFPGDEYAGHTKCITEAEKYSAKGWQPKSSANKGERKQQEWIENLQSLIAEKSSAGMSPEVRRVLDAVMCHENIPRKRQKFINFVKNIARGVRPAAIEETWEIFEEALRKKANPTPTLAEAPKQEMPKPEKSPNKEEEDDDMGGSSQEEEVEERLGVRMFTGVKENGTASGTAAQDDDDDEEPGEKKSKKSKKKEKRKKTALAEENGHGAEEEDEEDEEPGRKKRKKKDKKKPALLEENGHGPAEEGEEKSRKKKSKKSGKKRKRDEEGDDEEEVKKDIVDDEPKRKKKKRKNENEENEVVENNSHADEDTPEETASKFVWEDVIESLLSKEGEMKVKRLKKKVVSEYLSSHGDTHLTPEELSVKVDKKLAKNKRFRVLKECVRLKD